MRSKSGIALGGREHGQIHQWQIDAMPVAHAESFAIGAEVRAQRVVAIRYVLQRAVQRAAIKRAAQTQGDRFVAGQRSFRPEISGQPHLALQLSAGYHTRERHGAERVVADSC